jgi:hypothetical protein
MPRDGCERSQNLQRGEQRFLAESPMKPIGRDSPLRKTVELLGGTVARRWTVH